MKYFYTPLEIAVFILVSDFTRTQERKVIRDIWEKEPSSIPAKYLNNFALFRRHIKLERIMFDSSIADIDELNILMQDAEHAFSIDRSINEHSIIESYFKIIKLGLTYVEGKNYQKIKLRRLLKQFGYKRRSARLVAYIQKTLTASGLRTYLKGYVPCDIAKIDIDDMIMIRLKD